MDYMPSMKHQRKKQANLQPTETVGKKTGQVIQRLEGLPLHLHDVLFKKVSMKSPGWEL